MANHEKIEQLGVADNRNVHRDQIFKSIQRYCGDARTRLEKCLQEYNVYKNVNSAAKYLTSRPFLLAGVIAVISSIALPVILFTVFAVTTVACTFAGFVLVEGTILAFGTLVLCGVLLSIVTTIVMLGACLALTYYICFQVYTIVKRI